MILWKDGREPPDAAVKTGEGESLATYTGELEMTEAEVTETEEIEEIKVEEADATQPGKSLEQIIAEVGEKFAERGITRPEPQQAIHKVVEPRAMTRRRPMSGIRYLRRDMGTDADTMPIIVAEGQRLPAMMTLAAAGAAATQLVILEADEPETKKAEIIPIRAPLSEQQQKAEEFYRKTGITQEELKAMLAPSWTIAGALDPRENAKQLGLGLQSLWYDTELAALKIKHAVHEVLYKKRPL